MEAATRQDVTGPALVAALAARQNYAGRLGASGQLAKSGFARGQPPAASLALTRATSASFGFWLVTDLMA
jgi:hypothetical protein